MGGGKGVGVPKSRLCVKCNKVQLKWFAWERMRRRLCVRCLNKKEAKSDRRAPKLSPHFTSRRDLRSNGLGNVCTKKSQIVERILKKSSAERSEGCGGPRTSGGAVLIRRASK